MILTPFSRAGRDPFFDVRRLQNEINRMFGEFGTSQDAAGAYPAVNIWTGEHSVVVTAEVPGVKEEDLDLTVRAQTLTLQGKRNAKPDDEKISWHRRERGAGDFGRVIELPFPVDPDKVEARLKDGILEVEMQRPEAEKPKKIKIKAA